MWSVAFVGAVGLAASPGALGSARRGALAVRGLARRAGEKSPSLTEGQIAAWAQAATTFGTNTDFEIPDWTCEGVNWFETSWDSDDWTDDMKKGTRLESEGFVPLMSVIRSQSPADKISLVAVEDKALMHGAVDAISKSYVAYAGGQPIQQLPNLGVFSSANDHAAIEKLASELQGMAFVVKPSHLGASVGVSVVPASPGVDPMLLRAKIAEALHASADMEYTPSAAENAVRPGVLVQPLYPSFQDGNQESQEKVPAQHTVSFDESTGVIGTVPLTFVKRPLELRVQVMWGRVYMITMYGGGTGDGEAPEHFQLLITPEEAEVDATQWTCRYPLHPVDQFQELLELRFFLEYHQDLHVYASQPQLRKMGVPPPEAPPAFLRGSERAFLCDYVRKNFAKDVAAQAQHVATKLAAPWLRVDFFVPPPGKEHEWPIVLNEVEYNQGVEYRKVHEVPGQTDPESRFNVHDDDVISHEMDKVLLERSKASGRAMEEIRKVLTGGWRARQLAAGPPRLTPKEVFGAFGCDVTKPDEVGKGHGVSCKGDESSTTWWGNMMGTMLKH